MPVIMEGLVVGENYTRDELVNLWGYSGREAISRGIVTPANDKKIILFVTKVKQKFDTQYIDYLIGDNFLHMEGENGHRSDKRIINTAFENENIYLFYREVYRTPFKYFGEIFLVDHKLYNDKPSVFIFALNENTKKSSNSLINEYSKSGILENDFIADLEDHKKVEKHINYERSIKNRIKAIEYHGTICKVCEFDFNKFYGEDLAKDFIEMHYIKPLSSLKKEIQINPETGLVPLCSNCHSMVHRKRDTTIDIEDLKSRIKNGGI